MESPRNVSARVALNSRQSIKGLLSPESSYPFHNGVSQASGHGGGGAASSPLRVAQYCLPWIQARSARRGGGRCAGLLCGRHGAIYGGRRVGAAIRTPRAPQKYIYQRKQFGVEARIVGDLPQAAMARMSRLRSGDSRRSSSSCSPKSSASNMVIPRDSTSCNNTTILQLLSLCGYSNTQVASHVASRVALDRTLAVLIGDTVLGARMHK